MDQSLLSRARISAVLAFDRSIWETLQDSPAGTRRFTFSLPRALARHIRAKSICVIIGQSDDNGGLHIGRVKSKSTSTTLDVRFTLDEVSRADQDSLEQIHRDVGLNQAVGILAIRVTPSKSRILLSHLIKSAENRRIIERLSELISNSQRFANAQALEDSAVSLALAVFGIRPADGASAVALTDDRSAASLVRPKEDAVIEHDARWIPGMDLFESHMTGKAVFVRNHERLEVYTANKRDLELLFGVDLIYFNVPRSSIVMVQYKMLQRESDPKHPDEPNPEWIYRPDKQLAKEIDRMKRFAIAQGTKPYRLNSGPFYLKFVQRDAATTSPGFVLSLDHFA